MSTLQTCRLLLAADCVYDPESTEQLFAQLVLIIEFLALADKEEAFDYKVCVYVFGYDDGFQACLNHRDRQVKCKQRCSPCASASARFNIP